MSKLSRKQKKAMRALQREMLDNGELVTDDPVIVGDMAERMQQMSQRQPSQHDKGFTVTDHRRFDSMWDSNGVWKGNSEYNHSVGFHGSSGSSGYRPNDQDEAVFRCDSDDITKPCPIAKTPAIDIPKRLWQEFCDLAEGFKTEWLAYLQGQFNAETNRYTIERCYFPPQVVTGGHVEVDTDYEPLAGTVGAIHSHVNMAAFWSGEDMAHSNWPVEIVINARCEYEALVRMKLECGKWAKAKGTVYTVQPRSTEAYSAALKAAIEKGERLEQERRSKRAQSGYQPTGASGATATDLTGRPVTEVTAGRGPIGEAVLRLAAAGHLTTEPSLTIDIETGRVEDKLSTSTDDGFRLEYCESCKFHHTSRFTQCEKLHPPVSSEPAASTSVPDSTGHSVMD